jgi:hypothetical protein
MKELIALAKQRNAEGQPLSFGSGGTARRPISARKY